MQIYVVAIYLSFNPYKSLWRKEYVHIGPFTLPMRGAFERWNFCKVALIVNSRTGIQVQAWLTFNLAFWTYCALCLPTCDSCSWQGKVCVTCVSWGEVIGEGFLFFSLRISRKENVKKNMCKKLAKRRRSVFRGWGRCRHLWIWGCEEIHLSINDRKASVVLFKGTGFLEPQQRPGGQEAALTFPRRRSLRKTANAFESNLLEKSAWNLKPSSQRASLVCSWVVPLVTHLTDRGVS